MQNGCKVVQYVLTGILVSGVFMFLIYGTIVYAPMSIGAEIYMVCDTPTENRTLQPNVRYTHRDQWISHDIVLTLDNCPAAGRTLEIPTYERSLQAAQDLLHAYPNQTYVVQVYHYVYVQDRFLADWWGMNLTAIFLLMCIGSPFLYITYLGAKGIPKSFISHCKRSKSTVFLKFLFG